MLLVKNKTLRVLDIDLHILFCIGRLHLYECDFWIF